MLNRETGLGPPLRTGFFLIRAPLLRSALLFLTHSFPFSFALSHSFSLTPIPVRRETELHAYNPSARVCPSFLPPYVCPSRRCITRPTKTTMRLLLPPRPAIRRDATTSTYMIKPLSVRFSRASLSFVRVSSLSLSLALLRQKARYAEIARSKSSVEPSRNERESLLLTPYDSVANSLLAPCHYLPPTPSLPSSPPPPTPSSSSSSSYDGGFQRDVLAAANSMRDESGTDSSRTVTDTTIRRSIAGPSLAALSNAIHHRRNDTCVRLFIFRTQCTLFIMHTHSKSRARARAFLFIISLSVTSRRTVIARTIHVIPFSLTTSSSYKLYFTRTKYVVVVATGVGDDRYRDAAPPRHHHSTPRAPNNQRGCRR